MHRRYADPTQSLFVGSAVLFAGVLLGGVGLMQFLQGIAAVANDKVYASGGRVFDISVTAWGWVHMVVGLVAMVVSIGIIIGRRWGMVGGIGVAIVSAVSSFLFLPHNPAGAVILLGFDALILWALCDQLRVGDED